MTTLERRLSCRYWKSPPFVCCVALEVQLIECWLCQGPTARTPDTPPAWCRSSKRCRERCSQSISALCCHGSPPRFHAILYRGLLTSLNIPHFVVFADSLQGYRSGLQLAGFQSAAGSHGSCRAESVQQGKRLPKCTLLWPVQASILYPGRFPAI